MTQEQVRRITDPSCAEHTMIAPVQLDLNDLKPRAIVHDESEQRGLRQAFAENHAWSLVATAAEKALVTPGLSEEGCRPLRRLLENALAAADLPPQHLRLATEDRQAS